MINARSVVQKGYFPTQVDVEISTSEGPLTQTVPLDAFAYMGILKFPVTELSERELQSLTNGVSVLVTLKDATNQEILSKQSLGTVSFLPNPTPIQVDARLIPKTSDVSRLTLEGGTGLYLQKVAEDGTPSSMAMRWVGSPSVNSGMVVSTNPTFEGDQPDFVFMFTPVPSQNNAFYIQLESTGEYLDVGTTARQSWHLANHRGPRKTNRTSLNGLSQSDRGAFVFRFTEVSDGVYSMADNFSRPIKDAPGVGLTVDYPGAMDVYWRVVAKEVEWDVQPISASIIEPVLPKPSSGFGFNSTLTNCSRGELQQTVGAEFSEQRTFISGWSESIAVNNTKSKSVSATLDVSVNATFFGKGATYSASVTTGFEWSHSVTSTSSEYGERSITKQESFFSSRVITVPPRKASLVYDAYQYYQNVRVNTVQRFRITGRNERGRALSGEEISTLFRFSRFDGVINAVEENSIVITLRGFFIMDRIIDTQSMVQEVPANCN